MRWWSSQAVPGSENGQGVARGSDELGWQSRGRLQVFGSRPGGGVERSATQDKCDRKGGTLHAGQKQGSKSLCPFASDPQTFRSKDVIARRRRSV